MGRIRFTPPSAAELRKFAGMVGDQVTDAAEAAARHAQSIAPVDTGEYRSRFRVQPAGPDGEARVVNDDPGAVAIEFGTEDTPPHNVLAQTADWLEGGAS